ncbi:hypothetical protein M758_UG115300 [Ceratodon purpureus]|nr:hypothetical protein M758_UG115300 [Ceratodon purpureus]
MRFAFDNLRKFKFRHGVWSADCVFVKFVYFEPVVESGAMAIHGVQRHPKPIGGTESTAGSATGGSNNARGISKDFTQVTGNRWQEEVMAQEVQSSRRGCAFICPNSTS